ncbi:MAG: hypothetical protein AB7T49_10160 [Oligoflexales bacterium]
MQTLRVGILLSCVLVGCSSNTFSGSSKKGKPAGSKATTTNGDKTDSGDIGTGSENSKVFVVDTYKSGIDMVWIIDNSGSMSEEIEQVKTNFSRFVTSLSGITDMNVSLITCTGAGMGLCIDPSEFAAGKVNVINTEVGSYNPLAMLIGALCPPSESIVSETAEDTTLCGEKANSDVLEDNFGLPGEFWEYINPPVLGSLDKAFRKDAKKVFVVVSDENSFNFGSSEFKRVADKKLGKDNYSFFGFITMAKEVTACSSYIKGTAYIELSKQVNGGVFDICESDWSKNFDTLTKGVTEEARRTFVIEGGFGKIVSVTLNGRALSSSEYVVSGNSVSIAKEVALAAGAEVRISYELAQSLE